MAKELTEQLRSSKTIDWRQKESARANMRRMVKRLLKKYHYPPEHQEKALETVIRQCELLADDDTYEQEPMVLKAPISHYGFNADSESNYSIAADD